MFFTNTSDLDQKKKNREVDQQSFVGLFRVIVI